jgi:hypothetical protein
MAATIAVKSSSGGEGMMKIKDLLERDPFREIEGVIKITDHDPSRVWKEMDEYVPTEKVKSALRDILDTLLETKRGATERVCVWVSGFFGSGKSHFLKVLGYLLEDRELRDESGRSISSQEFLCRKFGFETYLPILQREFKTKVLFINLLDCDPNIPEQSTISRLILRSLMEEQGLSTNFWVAEWEKDLKRQGKWNEFQDWVKQKFKRPWEDERRLNAETVLKQALPVLLPERYRSEEESDRAIQESKRTYSVVEPSRAVGELVGFAEQLDENNGRVIVLLDEVGLYIGDSVSRLTDLNSVAEQVVQSGNGKILLIASAQEALRDLVPRLTRDAQILNWLQDRFRTRFHLEPTEVQQVVAERLLRKTPKGSEEVKKLLDQKSGAIRSALTIDQWQDNEFIAHYPCPPYAVRLVQDIMGSFHSSVEDARRLSGAARSVLQLVHSVLKGEGRITCGAEQQIGWLVPLDLFFDSLRGTLSVIRSEQISAFSEIERLGETDGLPVARIAKALFLLQQIGTRYPCTVENLASVLVDSVDLDIHALREKVRKGLQKLQEAGWVAEEEGKFRLLTPVQHTLEQEVNRNYPTLAELKSAVVDLLREMLRNFKFEHGEIRRPLRVAITVDDEPILGDDEGLKVALYTPFADVSDDSVLEQSVADDKTLFWKASGDSELEQVLKRAVAVRKTLEQWRTRTLSDEQTSYREQLEREDNQLWSVRLPQLITSAFMKGKVFIGGQEIQPSGEGIEAVIRGQLRTIAQRLYTEFIDKRPSREEDCASILTWRPGSALPNIYLDLQLITSDQQIRRDNQYLSIVKAEIQRRQDRGLDCSGKALAEHFEKPPYGWDIRLVRLFIATLMKAGLVGVRYQNRLITDPNDLQVRAVFSQAREFQRATFEILPEVDWRKASELCSEIFGVADGDTFERTASIVREQAQQWSQSANQLATRCRDNSLPAQLEQTCRQIADLLNAIAQIEEPNARLRQFLEIADELKQNFQTIRELMRFDFDRYRSLRSFIQLAGVWDESLEGESAERWKRLSEGVNAPDILDRWQSLQNDFAVLQSRYNQDYAQRHREFQNELTKAIKDLRKHPAFECETKQAENLLQPLKRLQCEGEGVSETDFVCPSCRRQFGQMSLEMVRERRREIAKQLDNLLPKPEGPQPVEPLHIERTIESEEGIEAIASEILRYFAGVRKPIKVKIDAEPMA